jgi:hypothetical protein
MEELKMKLQQYLQAEENPCCSENSLHEKNKSQFMICCFRYVKKKPLLKKHKIDIKFHHKDMKRE